VFVLIPTGASGHHPLEGNILGSGVEIWVDLMGTMLKDGLRKKVLQTLK
jgi:hypothetical protein